MTNLDKEKIRQLVKDGDAEQILEHIESLENISYDDGKGAGYDDGYDEGYNIGYTDACEEYEENE